MKKYITLGILRGFIWQIVGTVLGMGIVTGIRALLGLPAWKG